MRTVQTSQGPVDVRGLTAKDIRAGKDYGLRYFGMPDLEEHFEDARDFCISVLFGQEFVDTWPNADQNLLFTAILAETWGGPGEEKNSSTSGPNAQTKTE